MLAADDDADARTLVSETLESRGAKVVAVDSADEALVALKTIRPDVVITDYTLPGEDGFALADILRGAPATKHVPLILVSGRDFVGEAHTRALRLFDRVLLKPVLPDQLIAEMLPLVAERTGARRVGGLSEGLVLERVVPWGGNSQHFA